MKLILKVDAARVASLIDALARLKLADSMTVEPDNDDAIGELEMEETIEASNDDTADLETQIATLRAEVESRKRGVNNRTLPATADRRTRQTGQTGQTVSRPFGAAVLYSTAKSMRDVKAALATMNPSATNALVLADVANHPKSRNAEIRKRLAPKLAKTGKSVESVDNVVWQLVNKGLIVKEYESK